MSISATRGTTPFYDVTVRDDMGHLDIHGPNRSTLPLNILEYLCQQSRRYLIVASDKTMPGIRYYCLPDTLKNKWTYSFGNTTVQIHWDVGKFDPAIMELVR